MHFGPLWDNLREPKGTLKQAEAKVWRVETDISVGVRRNRKLRRGVGGGWREKQARRF